MNLQELKDTCPSVGDLPLLDPCLILRRAGQGGMGSVWKGYDVWRERWLAVKICEEPELAKRFGSEAKTGMRIHKQGLNAYPDNALVIHDIRYMPRSGMPYILMEWVDGQDLQVVGLSRALSAEQIYTIALHTARGLVTMHAEEILHRDIKPANLMLTNEGVVKVVDFGIAKGKNVLHEPTGGSIGTRLFMAPETLLDNRATAASDVYALGVTLYVLARRLLDNREENQQLLNQLMAGQHAPLVESVTGFDPGLAQLIERCMAHDPLLRPQNASEMLVALESLELEPARLPSGRTAIHDEEPSERVIDEACQRLSELPGLLPDPESGGGGRDFDEAEVSPPAGSGPEPGSSVGHRRGPRAGLQALIAVTAVALLTLFAWASQHSDDEPDDAGRMGAVQETDKPTASTRRVPAGGTDGDLVSGGDRDPEGMDDGIPRDDDLAQELAPKLSPFEQAWSRVEDPEDRSYPAFRLNPELGAELGLGEAQDFMVFLRVPREGAEDAEGSGFAGDYVAKYEFPWALAIALGEQPSDARDRRTGELKHTPSHAWGPRDPGKFEAMVAMLNQRLSNTSPDPGFEFAIPTVAEWERIAARAAFIDRGGWRRSQHGADTEAITMQETVGEFARPSEASPVTPRPVDDAALFHAATGFYGLLAGSWEACLSEEGEVAFRGCSERSTQEAALTAGDLTKAGSHPGDHPLSEYYSLRLIVRRTSP